MTGLRLSRSCHADIHVFADDTISAWMKNKFIKSNSWGVEIIVAETPGADFGLCNSFGFGAILPTAEHDENWYRENAIGKNRICLATGMDSFVAVRLFPGLVRQIEGAFPWGGAIIDTEYGLIIGTSGFKEDEDILVSRTVRDRLIMLLDREGEALLADARVRGEQAGEDGADRFTCV